MRAAALPERLLDLLYPPRCAACNRSGAWFCPSCRATVRGPSPPLCPRCGQELSGSACRACAASPPITDAVRAAGLYEGALRQAILRLKYGNLTAAAPALAQLLQLAYGEAGWRCDIVVPVPLHPSRERQRGYNQSAALAAPLARALGLPWSARLLRRARRTADQIGLDGADRRANVAGAFQAARSDVIAGRSVLLVDDVATTGCTLDACARALRDSGAASVFGLVLARRSLDEERGAADAKGKP